MAVARNVIANTVGTVVLVGAGAALTILSFRLAGPEQYGLIGFYLTLNGLVAILDTGLGPGVVREVARARAGSHPDALNTILFTFQGVYLGLTGLTALVLIAASSLIATTWLTARTIPVAEIQLALILAALVIALQRLRTVYSVFLEGMEQQVIINLLLSSSAVLRALVVLGAMVLIAPTATVFLSAALCVGLLELVVFFFIGWRAAHGVARPRFSFALMGKLWRYLITSSLAVAVGAVLANADKAVVSAALPLDVVGRYIFISQICLIVLKLVAPNVTAIFPRLTASVHRGDSGETRRVYFAASQTAVCIVAAFMLGASFFGYEALLILTGSRVVARDYQLFFAVLAWGYGLNSLCLIPNALRMVEGFPGTALWGNIVAAILYLPAVALLTPRYGVLAPASLWLVVNALLLIMFAARSHRHALAGQAWAWLSSCLLPQFAATAAVFAITKAALLHTRSLPVIVASVLVATGVAFLASIAASGDLRHSVISFLRRLRAVPTQTVPAR